VSAIDFPNNPTVGQVFTAPNGTQYTWDGAVWKASGPSGGGGATAFYHHVQATAATTWAITHNLSFYPNVTAVDSTGREITPGDVSYLNTASVTLTFSAAVGGDAYLS